MHSVGRAALWGELAARPRGAGALLLEAIAWNQGHHEREAIRRRDQEAAIRIVGDAAPVRPADVAGKDDRALKAGRREDALVPETRDPRATRVAVALRESPRILGAEARRDQRARLDRERLRRRRLFSGHRALRDRALLDGEQRLAGLAVQDEEMSHLGRDDDGGHGLALLGNVTRTGCAGTS